MNINIDLEDISIGTKYLNINTKKQTKMSKNNIQYDPVSDRKTSPKKKL
jgi:hypothetical protein